MSHLPSIEDFLQRLFLEELNAYDLFDGESPHHVHVHRVDKDSAGTEQYVLELFVGGTHCQAGGFYAGDQQSGVLRIDWAMTPCEPGHREYGVSIPFDHRKGRPVEHVALALAT